MNGTRSNVGRHCERSRLSIALNRVATVLDRLGAPRPTLSHVTTNDGRSPGSRVIASSRLPRDIPVALWLSGSPLTVAGAAPA